MSREGGDDALRDLARRSDAAPDDQQAALRAASVAIRRGLLLDARRFVLRALARQVTADGMHAAVDCALPFVLLPHEDRHALLAVHEGRLHPIARLPFAPTSRPLLAPGIVAGFADDADGTCALIVLSLTSGLRPREGPKLDAAMLGLDPLLDVRSPSLAAAGSTLYAGGRGWVALRDLDERDGDWTLLELPSQCAENTVDALLLVESRLFVVDDVIEPKYMPVYDVSNALAPELQSVVDLPIGINRSITTAVAGAGSIAILSGGIHMGGSYYSIDFFDIESTTLRASIDISGERLRERWTDVAFHGGRLLVGSSRGLLELDLSQVVARSGRPATIPATRLRVVANPLKQGELIERLAPVPGSRSVALAIRSPAGIRHEIVSLGR